MDRRSKLRAWAALGALSLAVGCPSSRTAGGDPDAGGGDAGAPPCADDRSPFVPACDAPAADVGPTPPACGAPAADWAGAERPGTAPGRAWWAGWSGLGDDGTSIDAPGCPSGLPIEPVGGDVTADRTWTADRCWQLVEPVFVRNGAVLTLEAGTTVLGGDGGSWIDAPLVVTSQGRLVAEGTRDAPITFTPVGLDAEDPWVGDLILLGRAPVNDVRGTMTVEGLEPVEGRGLYGGDDPIHDCGVVRYVRFFRGGTLGRGVDLSQAALHVNGCGSETRIDHVAVHAPYDDAIHVNGGFAAVRDLVVTDAPDDGVDVDLGYRGVVRRILALRVRDRAFEIDNNGDGRQNAPRSQPTICNATVIGDPSSTSAEGFRLREGTAGLVTHAIVTGYPQDQCVEVQHVETAAQVDVGALALRHSVLGDCEAPVRFSVGDACTDFEPDCPVSPGVDRALTCPADGTADEYECALAAPYALPWLDGPSFGNVVADPGLALP